MSTLSLKNISPELLEKLEQEKLEQTRLLELASVANKERQKKRARKFAREAYNERLKNKIATDRIKKRCDASRA